MTREEFNTKVFNHLGNCIIKETTGNTIYDLCVKENFIPRTVLEPLREANKEMLEELSMTIRSYPQAYYNLMEAIHKVFTLADKESK